MDGMVTARLCRTSAWQPGCTSTPTRQSPASRVCIKRLVVPGQKSCAVVAYQRWCWRVHLFIQVVVIVERLGTKFYDLSTRIQTKFTASLCKGFVLLERFQTNLKFCPCTECQQWNPSIQFQNRLCTLTSQSVDPRAALDNWSFGNRFVPGLRSWMCFAFAEPLALHLNRQYCQTLNSRSAWLCI